MFMYMVVGKEFDKNEINSRFFQKRIQNKS